MSHDILLSFDTATLPASAGTPSDFEVRLQTPINIPDLNYSVSLVKLNTWYSLHNFNALEHANTTFDIDDGVTNSVIVVPDGIYSFEDFNDFMVENLTAAYAPASPLPVVFSVNNNTGKFSIVLQAGVTMIISQSSASNFGLVDRFASSYDKTALNSYTAGGSALTLTSLFTPQWNNNIQSFNLEVDLTNNATLNGKNSQIIAMFSPRTSPFGSIEFEPKNLVFQQVNKTSIQSVRLRLTDQSGNTIGLNGENMSVLLLIRRIN
jgi:hypothetical protein